MEETTWLQQMSLHKEQICALTHTHHPTTCVLHERWETLLYVGMKHKHKQLVRWGILPCRGWFTSVDVDVDVIHPTLRVPGGESLTRHPGSISKTMKLGIVASRQKERCVAFDWLMLGWCWLMSVWWLTNGRLMITWWLADGWPTIIILSFTSGFIPNCSLVWWWLTEVWYDAGSSVGLDSVLVRDGFEQAQLPYW